MHFFIERLSQTWSLYSLAVDFILISNCAIITAYFLFSVNCSINWNSPSLVKINRKLYQSWNWLQIACFLNVYEFIHALTNAQMPTLFLVLDIIFLCLNNLINWIHILRIKSTEALYFLPCLCNSVFIVMFWIFLNKKVVLNWWSSFFDIIYWRFGNVFWFIEIWEGFIFEKRGLLVEKRGLHVEKRGLLIEKRRVVWMVGLSFSTKLPLRC